LLREKCSPWFLGIDGSFTLGFTTKKTFIGQEQKFGSKEFTLETQFQSMKKDVALM